MGIAEIQAAFAANAAQPSVAANPFGGGAPAPTPFAQQLAPAQPGFGQGPAPTANPFAAAAQPFQAPAVAAQAAFAAAAQAPAPAPFGVAVAALSTPQGAFAFTPPAGFNPASTPPINPVGERASLNTAPAVEAPVAPVVVVEPAVEAPVAPVVVVEPVVEAPKARRTRKPKADAVIEGASAEVQKTFEAGYSEANEAAMTYGAEPDFTTEQLVQFLVDRGYAVRLERA